MTDMDRTKSEDEQSDPLTAPQLPSAPAASPQPPAAAAAVPPQATAAAVPPQPPVTAAAAAAPADMPSVDQAIALREQAPELYELWLKIAKDKAATANYVERAPYEVPERLAQSGRPRALGAMVIVLSFCGYLAWLGGPGPYIGGLIAILDLGAMFGMFFGLTPDRLSDSSRSDRRRLLSHALDAQRAECRLLVTSPR
jgi:hypothetical protein